MAPIIVIALYAVMFLLLKAVAAIEMSNEVRLAANVIGAVVALMLPIFLASVVDTVLTQKAANAVGRNWCIQNKVDFEKVEMHKNHFSLIFREAGQKLRRKFRVRFIFTTWFVRHVEWLEK